MNIVKKKLKEIKNGRTDTQTIFKNEAGAIDLASIMVGVVVIGMIGGVISATVFSVIPWAQDKAAQAQLGSLHSAQSAYYGLSSDPSSTLPTGAPRNSFYDSEGLAAANLMPVGTNYCTIPTNGGKDYDAYSKSASGKIFKSSSGYKKPVEVPSNETLTGSCAFLTSGAVAGSYVDPTPTLTTMTYQCNTDNPNLTLPWKNVKGTITWSDGTTQTYANTTATPTVKALTANTPYTVTLDGTFSDFFYSTKAADQQCIRSLDHWGTSTGTTTAYRAFQGATNLVSVPDHIPSTLTNTREMFVQATKLNDPNISKWDTSNVTNMAAMFYQATAFNQNLNDWNVSNVTDMTSMFYLASNFNQPVDKWKTSKVTSMLQMFASASKFNQPLNSWDVTSVTTIEGMFHRAYAFNQPLNSWTTTSLTNMMNTFYEATAFNQPLNNWNTSKVTNMNSTFFAATAYNQNLSTWNVAAVTTHNNFTNAGYNAAFLPAFPS